MNKIEVTETSEGWRIENEYNSSITLTKEQIGLLYHQVFTGAKCTSYHEIIGANKEKQCPQCGNQLVPRRRGGVECSRCTWWKDL